MISSAELQNFISAIQDGDRIAVSQSDKDNVAFQFFSQSIGTPKPRSLALNWEALGYEQFDLDSLDSPFTEQEISLVIKEMPSMKAPGPDGFIGLFYKKCWNVIKYDLMEAVQAFYNHRTSKLNLLNEANIILLRKKQEASSMADYRPISLINSVVKIITKILASRLAPKLDNMVSNAQNAFIRKRCIHGNFIYARKVIQTLHKKNNPALFIKLDISEAFDSISWPYLLEVFTTRQSIFTEGLSICRGKMLGHSAKSLCRGPDPR